MQKIAQKQFVKISKPMVFLPLREWKRIEKELDERDELVRFNTAFDASRGKEMISLEDLGRKRKLQ